MDILDYNTISTPQDRQEVVNMVKEASASMLRIDSERDLMKDIATRAKEEFEIKPADFNQVVKMYHKQNRQEAQAKYEKIDGLYEKLFDEDE